MKPGWRTTEFWLTLLTMAMAAASQRWPELMNLEGLLAMVLASAGYTGSRALVKRANPTGGAAEASPPGAAPPAASWSPQNQTPTWRPGPPASRG